MDRILVFAPMAFNPMDDGVNILGVCVCIHGLKVNEWIYMQCQQPGTRASRRSSHYVVGKFTRSELLCTHTIYMVMVCAGTFGVAIDSCTRIRALSHCSR